MAPIAVQRNGDDGRSNRESTTTCEADQEKRSQRIAIIGTGLAGLSASYLLNNAKLAHNDRFEVHLFERNDNLGLDSHSIAVGDRRVDVPMRSVNSGYYPNLIALYKHLGIRLRHTNFTYSFAVQGHQQPFLLYNGMSGLRGLSIPRTSNHANQPFAARCVSLFQQSHLLLIFVVSYVYLLIVALYHHLCGHLLDQNHTLASEPFHVWLRRHERWIDHAFFVEHVLYATFSAVTTSSYEHVKQLPTSEVLLYIATTFARSHYTVQGGVECVERALLHNVERQHTHLHCNVEQIIHDKQTGRAIITYTDSSAAGQHTLQNQSVGGFDHVILACPANLSAKLVQTYASSLSEISDKKTQQDQLRRHEMIVRMQALRDCLACVPYELTTVINHQDESLLPRRLAHRRDLNLVIDICPKTGDRQMMSTHVVSSHKSGDKDNQSPTAHAVFQTTTMSTCSAWPLEDRTLSRSTIARAITPHASKQTLSGLFVRRRTHTGVRERVLQVVSHALRRLISKSKATASKVQQSEYNTLTLKDDWLSVFAYFITGRRYQLSLGSLQSSESSCKIDAKNEDGNDPSHPVASLPSIWACGSYAQGIPLLEGCVTSSNLIVREIVHRHNAQRT